MVALEMTDKKGVGCRCLVEGKSTPATQGGEAIKPVKSRQSGQVPTKLLLELKLQRLHREVEASLHQFKMLKDEEIPWELLRSARLGPGFASPRFPLYDNPALARLCLAVCEEYENDNAYNAEVGRRGLKSYVFPLLERHPSLWYTAAPILLDGLPGHSEEFQEARDKYVDCITPAARELCAVDSGLSSMFYRMSEIENQTNDFCTLTSMCLIECSSWLRSLLLASRHAIGRKEFNMHFTNVLLSEQSSELLNGQSMTTYVVCFISVFLEDFFVHVAAASNANALSPFGYCVFLLCEWKSQLTHIVRELEEDPYLLLLQWAVLRGQKDEVSRLQSNKDIRADNLEAGNAYRACVQDGSSVVRLQAYKVPLAASGGSLAYHSLVVATLSSGKGFVLEKYDIQHHRADQDEFKNGVLVSDVRNIRYFGEQYANIEIAKDRHVKASDIHRTMVETGPYSVDRANCQHAADAVLKKFSSTEQEWVPKPNEKAIGFLQIIDTCFGPSCKHNVGMSPGLVSSGLASVSERFVFGRTATD